ncbi:MAG: hypothetical protein N2V78_06905 [Methanophagales archaeon]|nr:hypothetical protein [Methanophagales archaeon]
MEVVLVNSNPATIMTDFEMADEIYIEISQHFAFHNFYENFSNSFRRG